MKGVRSCIQYIIYAAIANTLIFGALIGYWSWSTNNLLAANEVYDAAQDVPGEIYAIEGYNIHVQTMGDPQNQPLLLIHGFGVEGGLFWGEFAELLAEDYYLIMPDLLGFGHSERVITPDDGYTHAGQVEILAGVLDELQISQANVLGNSYGGGLAAQMALDYPEKVNQIVLIAPQVFDLGGNFFQSLVSIPFGIGRAMTWSAQGGGPRADNLARMGCEDGSNYCPSQEELNRRRRLADIDGTTDALIAFSTTPPDARLPEDLSEIDKHVLVIWGPGDTVISYADYSSRVIDALPSAELIVMDGHGHNPYKTGPDEAAAYVKEFLE
ncbi:MAG: alpha/beta hydrolase [Ardenticatenaceae bacterium]|nr:alpha/beta hydrolase [Ardenticatenaceae bacterium]